MKAWGAQEAGTEDPPHHLAKMSCPGVDPTPGRSVLSRRVVPTRRGLQQAW